jgi:hypothetical protein
MNKVILITGGSSGIGKSIGEFLFSKGFIVYGTSRNPDKITKPDSADLQSVPIPTIKPNLRFINSISYLLILSIYCVGTDCKSALTFTNENFTYPSDRGTTNTRYNQEYFFHSFSKMCSVLVLSKI